jgi:hypothetical protein
MDTNKLSNSSSDGPLALAVGRRAALIDYVDLRPRNQLLTTLSRGARPAEGRAHPQPPRHEIRVLDRSGLERASCECCRAIRSQYERLLPLTHVRQLSFVDQPSLSRAFG